MRAAIRKIAFVAAGAAIVVAQASARDISVGTGAGYDHRTLAAAVAAARPHDRIQIAAGTYQNDFVTVDVPLTIEGLGGIAVLSATVQIPNGKAILISNADLTIRNVEFRGAKVADKNGAGIRAQRGNLTIENSIFRSNENGILAASDANVSIRISKSQFIDNGFGDGQTHGIYVNRIAMLSVIDSEFSGTKVGHDIKSRAITSIITNNILDDGVSGTTSYAIDLPNGGVGTIIGNDLTQGERTENPAMISFGAEDNLHPDSSLLVRDNKFTNRRRGSSVGVFNHTDIAVTLEGNAFDAVQTPLRGPGKVVGAKVAP